MGRDTEPAGGTTPERERRAREALSGQRDGWGIIGDKSRSVIHAATGHLVVEIFPDCSGSPVQFVEPVHLILARLFSSSLVPLPSSLRPSGKAALLTVHLRSVLPLFLVLCRRVTSFRSLLWTSSSLDSGGFNIGSRVASIYFIGRPPLWIAVGSTATSPYLHCRSASIHVGICKSSERCSSKKYRRHKVQEEQDTEWLNHHAEGISVELAIFLKK
ncbi:hypothetical protein BS78_01G233800 [Paspalum vaginatum]|nr:hypothetical protein BS78_01G233800 [Paspalum vaginatum]